MNLKTYVKICIFIVIPIVVMETVLFKIINRFVAGTVSNELLTIAFVCVLGYPILKYINFVLSHLNKPN